MSTLERHKLVKETVWNVLKDDERSRNDDKWLILKVLQRVGQQIVLGEKGFVWYCDYQDFKTIPNFETIRRVRQEIQNTDRHWLPTDPKVLWDRRIKEETIRQYYREYPKIIQEYQNIAFNIS